MKLKNAVLIVLGLVACVTLAWAQSAVQQTSTMLNAVAAANYNGTAQGTITLTPPPSWYVYVTDLDAQHCASGTAGAAGTPVFITSTNLPNLPRIGTDTLVPIATCIFRNVHFAQPLKSAAAGTAVTVVTPAAETNVTYNLNVYYYFGL